MNINTDAKFFIDNSLDATQVADRLATTILTFKSNSFIIDYKIYEILKSIATIGNPYMLRIEHKYLRFILYLSIIDSNFLSVEKYVSLTDDLNHFHFYVKPDKNNLINPILFTMK